MRSDISDERYKEKREEVNKTIKEREYLQRKTNEMIQAMQNEQIVGKNKMNSPHILHKGQCLLDDVKSDIDAYTVLSNSSSKTFISTLSNFSTP